MRSLEERGTVLNMYFHEGIGHKGIAKITGVPLETVKSWCRRYQIKNDIPKRGRTPLFKEPLKKETIRSLLQETKILPKRESPA